MCSYVNAPPVARLSGVRARFVSPVSGAPAAASVAALSFAHARTRRPATTVTHNNGGGGKCAAGDNRRPWVLFITFLLAVRSRPRPRQTAVFPSTEKSLCPPARKPTTTVCARGPFQGIPNWPGKAGTVPKGLLKLDDPPPPEDGLPNGGGWGRLWGTTVHDSAGPFEWRLQKRTTSVILFPDNGRFTTRYQKRFRVLNLPSPLPLKKKTYLLKI